MRIELDLQLATVFEPLPARGQFLLWVRTALGERKDAALTVRLVDREESRSLNEQYRGKKGPTNVLSFPAELPPEIDIPLLGDIVICAPLVAEEAESQSRESSAHWAHLTIHGVLHLMGFDHQTSHEAEIMEAMEVDLLKNLGIASPYE